MVTASSLLAAFRLRRAGAAVRVWADYVYDFRRFMRWSASGVSELSEQQLVAHLFKSAHSIEKALALPMFRPGSSERALTAICNALASYNARGGDRSHIAYIKAKAAISSYVAHHRRIGAAVPDKVTHMATHHMPELEGTSTLELKRADVLSKARGDFRELLDSRHSVRMFGPEPVSMELIRSAITMALQSPSVCNRQGARAYALRDPALLSSVLEIQGGNRGFSSEINTVLVVTCSLSIFKGGRERNQAWIDGGLFAMTLMYALQYLGVGSCPLNWSADRGKDRALRNVVDIPPEDSVVMLLAVGTLREAYTVARSPRRLESETFRELNAARKQARGKALS